MPGADADYQHYPRPGSNQQDLRSFGFMSKEPETPTQTKSLELPIDYSESQLPFYEEAFDQDFQASADHSTV